MTRKEKLIEESIKQIQEFFTANGYQIIESFPYGDNHYGGVNHVLVIQHRKPILYPDPDPNSVRLSFYGDCRHWYRFSFDYFNRLRKVVVYEVIDGSFGGCIEELEFPLPAHQRFLDKTLFRRLFSRKRSSPVRG